jgi:hypothetical protein
MSHHKHEHGNAELHPGMQDSPATLAYHLWEQAGRPEGKAEGFWWEAERQIKQQGRPHAK